METPIETREYLGFPNMRDILPEGVMGTAKVEYFTISEAEASFASLKAMYDRNPLDRHLYAGDFVKLHVDGEMMFSDAGGERYSNREIVWNSHGKVLIAGLGLGMILTKIASKPDVKYITVVEKSRDVIGLVESHIRKYLGNDSAKLEVVESDIFDFVPCHKYNTIFFDIWGNYSGDTYEQTKKLHRRFSKYLDRSNSPYMDSWMRWHMRRLHFGE